MLLQMGGMIQVVCVRNPFDPLASREIRKVYAGYSIRELVRGFDVSPGYDVAVSVDGRVLTSPEKMEYIPSAGSSVVFCAVPQGGDGKNPMAIVAMLAVIALAGAVPGMLPVVMSSMMETMVTGSIIVAGGLLVSAIFPISTPSVAAGPESSSPTYSWEVKNNAVAEGYRFLSCTALTASRRRSSVIISKRTETSSTSICCSPLQDIPLTR